MVKGKSKRLTRDAWLKGALSMCEAGGIEGVKIEPLATTMGVTTGSFYWHFKNRQELLHALLEYWEREMTDAAITAAREFPGSAMDRIRNLMETVMAGNLARYDLPIWHWAQSDRNVERVFKRVLRKWFSFATRMFSEAGFSAPQAAARGRMMVVYMMGELTLVPGSMPKRKDQLKLTFAILTAPES